LGAECAVVGLELGEFLADDLAVDPTDVLGDLGGFEVGDVDEAVAGDGGCADVDEVDAVLASAGTVGDDGLVGVVRVASGLDPRARHYSASS
jgi:hypothetical protein